MLFHAIPCNIMQYYAIPCNTMQYHAIQCNNMQYHAIPCNTMQYHGTLITADGAYHCPVGSIMAIFSIENAKFWTVLAILSQIYALFGGPFTGLDSVVMPQY